ncbi:hypothetical protein EDB89DRAFT_819456 [Lactarius sanguifluus]|nr:hypothetical protein EDB89DRAFT_819456 [Lactarius sanguifluus]
MKLIRPDIFFVFCQVLHSSALVPVCNLFLVQGYAGVTSTSVTYQRSCQRLSTLLSTADGQGHVPEYNPFLLPFTPVGCIGTLMLWVGECEPNSRMVQSTARHAQTKDPSAPTMPLLHLP